MTPAQMQLEVVSGVGAGSEVELEAQTSASGAAGAIPEPGAVTLPALPSVPPQASLTDLQAEAPSAAQQQEQQQSLPQGNGRIFVAKLAFAANQLTEAILPWVTGHTGIPMTVASTEALSSAQFPVHLDRLMSLPSAGRQTLATQGFFQAEGYELLIAGQGEEGSNHWVTIGYDEQGLWYSTDPENPELADVLTERGIVIFQEPLPLANACGVTGAVLMALQLGATPQAPFSWAAYDQITRGLLAFRLMPAAISPAGPALPWPSSASIVVTLPSAPLLRLEGSASSFQGLSNQSVPTTGPAPSNLNVTLLEDSDVASNSSLGFSANLDEVSSDEFTNDSDDNTTTANAADAAYAHTNFSNPPAWAAGIIQHAQQAAAVGNHEAAGLALAGLGLMNGGPDVVAHMVEAHVGAAVGAVPPAEGGGGSGDVNDAEASPPVVAHPSLGPLPDWVVDAGQYLQQAFDDEAAHQVEAGPNHVAGFILALAELAGAVAVLAAGQQQFIYEMVVA